MSTNPFYHQVYFDSCAFDGGNESEQKASLEVRKIFKDNGGNVNIVHSVVKEIEYPNTPQWVQDIAVQSIRTVEIPLIQQELDELKEIQNIIIGNSSLKKREADCMHVFEAQKYGRYFVTTDRGIFKHAPTIRKRFSLVILKPSEFLEIVKENITNRSSCDLANRSAT